MNSLFRYADLLDHADEFVRGPRDAADFDWWLRHGKGFRPPQRADDYYDGGLLSPYLVEREARPPSPGEAGGTGGPFGLWPDLARARRTGALPPTHPLAIPGAGLAAYGLDFDAGRRQADWSRPLAPPSFTTSPTEGVGLVPAAALPSKWPGMPLEPQVSAFSSAAWNTSSRPAEADEGTLHRNFLDSANLPLRPALSQGPIGLELLRDLSSPGETSTAAGPDGESVSLAQAGNPSGQPTPRNPGLEYSLDQIERNFRSIVPGWRKQGWIESAANLEWFLNGGGATRVIERDRARMFPPIQEAEQTNTRRTENSFVDPDPKHGHAEKLKKMLDGETISISDRWNRDFKDEVFAKQVLRSSTRDFAIAFGNTKVRTVGDFKVTRHGDEFKIEGTVVHEWKDRYEFHPDRYAGVGGFFAKAAAELEKHRGARPFDIYSAWPRRVSGTIRIENGVLKSPQFAWEDIDD